MVFQCPSPFAVDANGKWFFPSCGNGLKATDANLEGQVAIVTGGSAGIGKVNDFDLLTLTLTLKLTLTLGKGDCANAS
jgi:hypothetical protein